jgi:FKBP-type peptidyl-prolyl cis-trans isomerase
MKRFLLLTTASLLSICGVFTVSSESAMAQQPKAAAAAPALGTDKQKASYGIGMRIGNEMRSGQLSADDIDMAAFVQGISDAVAKKKQAVSDEDLQKAMTSFHTELTARMQERAKSQGDKNKKEGEAFLAANKSKEGVKTLPSGLQYKVIKAGTGATPAATDTVKVHYKGTLLDGTVFDSSYDRNEPVTFPVNGVIKGWTEAMQLMKVGDKWQLFLPADLAYGEHGAGSDIGPNAVLVFDVELLDVSKGETLPGMGLPGGK